MPEKYEMVVIFIFFSIPGFMLGGGKRNDFYDEYETKGGNYTSYNLACKKRQ